MLLSEYPQFVAVIVVALETPSLHKISFMFTDFLPIEFFYCTTLRVILFLTSMMVTIISCRFETIITANDRRFYGSKREAKNITKEAVPIGWEF